MFHPLKDQPDGNSEGAKRGEAPAGFIYGIDRTSEGVTSDRLANDSMFEEIKKKHTRYREVRDWLIRHPLADAERKVVEAADQRSVLYTLPITIATFFGPSSVWAYNHFVRTVQNRFLRTIAVQPLRFHFVYAIPASLVWCYLVAEIDDKVFTRDSGIVQLAQKYQLAVGSQDAKRDDAPDGFVYHLDDTSEGVTSGETTPRGPRAISSTFS